MKIEVNEELEKFKPCSITITMESAEELREVLYRFRPDISQISSLVCVGNGWEHLTQDNTERVYREILAISKRRGIVK